MEASMDDEDKRITPQQIGALGVGLLVTITSSLLTSLVIPVPFPLNFLISLGLGATAGYGALKVLDPRTRQELIETQTSAEYRQKLQEIARITTQMDKASQGLIKSSPEVSGRLDHIARITRMILKRYTERRRDFAGVSATLLILQKFEGILVHYLKVKRRELFLDKEQREKEIAATETHVIPGFEIALENLGKKLDAGETLDKSVSKGTLESMLRSLDLIESLSDQVNPSSDKGDFDDQNT
jgi:hypothetical protein